MRYRPSRRILSRLLSVILLVATLLVLVLAGPLATGRIAFVGTHGVSMNPVYYQGDLVLVVKNDSYRVGQIVAYRVPAKHIVVLHRIIGEADGGFVMKGDNNQSIDPTHPSADLVIGRAILLIPHGDIWRRPLTSPAALTLLAVALAAGGGTTIQNRRRRRHRRLIMASHTIRSPASKRAVTTLPPPLRTAAAALGLLALALTALAWSAPLERSVTTQAPVPRQMTFSYTAAVGQSAAYDTSTAHSPDPVFRKLANTVDVHFTYHGAPGSVNVTAQLSTTSGWHTSVPLAGPTSFTGTEYHNTVQLDLNAFDTRASAAATVTGLTTGALTVTLTPRVQTSAKLPFQPALTLALSPLELTLPGGAKDLTVTDSTTVAHQTHVAATLNLAGRHIGVAGLRIISTVLLLLLLTAGALALLAQRVPASDDEAAAIRRRYAPLLVAVHPMPAPLGQPIIDVTTFATLAKLAERYGTLILHWTRSDIETFIVQDDGSIYRYRAGAATHATPTAAPTPTP